MKEKQKKKYKFQCISGFHCVKNAIFSIFQGTFSCHLFDFPLLLQQIFSIY